MLYFLMCFSFHQHLLIGENPSSLFTFLLNSTIQIKDQTWTVSIEQWNYAYKNFELVDISLLIFFLGRLVCVCVRARAHGTEFSFQFAFVL